MESDAHNSTRVEHSAGQSTRSLPGALRGTRSQCVQDRLLLSLAALVKDPANNLAKIAANQAVLRARGDEHDGLVQKVKALSACIVARERDAYTLAGLRKRLDYANVAGMQKLLAKIAQLELSEQQQGLTTSETLVAKDKAVADLASFRKLYGMKQVPHGRCTNSRDCAFEKEAMDYVESTLFPVGDGARALTQQQIEMIECVGVSPSKCRFMSHMTLKAYPDVKVRDGTKQGFNGVIVEVDDKDVFVGIRCIFEVQQNPSQILNALTRIDRLADYTNERDHVLLKSNKGLDVSIPLRQGSLSDLFVFLTPVHVDQIPLPADLQHLLVKCLAEQPGLSSELVTECLQQPQPTLPLFNLYKAAVDKFLACQPHFENYVQLFETAMARKRILHFNPSE